MSFPSTNLRNLGRAHYEAIGLCTQTDHETDLGILQEICGRECCQMFRQVVDLLAGSSADWPTWLIRRMAGKIANGSESLSGGVLEYANRRFVGYESQGGHCNCIVVKVSKVARDCYHWTSNGLWEAWLYREPGLHSEGSRLFKVGRLCNTSIEIVKELVRV